ncbi:CHAT domain-containing protein [Plantactinospora siamensis]|uniref:CHAT domain-containing protein n=1 Tax=Plantactinospora siamensis TaxID=555372 RepID=A0ABV6NWM3_9ACTN
MAAETIAEFIEDLRRLRTESGCPSLRDIARLSRQHTKRLPHSTAGDLLKSTSRPPVRSVIAFIVACREHAKELGLDIPSPRTDLTGWQLRWQALPDGPLEPPLDVDAIASPDIGRREKSRAGEEHVWLPAPGSEYLILSWSDFGSLPGLPELARQTHQLADALASAAPWCTVTVEHNVTMEQAREAVRRSASQARDVTFLHLATHAVLDEQDRLTLVLGDDQRRSVVPAEDLIRPLLRNKPVVVILDSCYAGGVTGDLIRDPAGTGLALVLAAAGATQFALAGEGSLTGILARLFALGDPTLPPLLTVRSVFDWLMRAVKAGHLRTDVRLGTRNGPRPQPECIRLRPFAEDIVIATNRAWVRPASELPGTDI